MGYSLKDLENAGKIIHDTFEENSRRKGEEFANRITSNTQNGRGLWIFILWPAFYIVATCVAMLVGVFLKISTFISICIGVVAAYLWYKADFTRQHPFRSSVFAFFAFIILFSVFK